MVADIFTQHPQPYPLQPPPSPTPNPPITTFFLNKWVSRYLIISDFKESENCLSQ